MTIDRRSKRNRHASRSSRDPSARPAQDRTSTSQQPGSKSSSTSASPSLRHCSWSVKSSETPSQDCERSKRKAHHHIRHEPDRCLEHTGVLGDAVRGNRTTHGAHADCGGRNLAPRAPGNRTRVDEEAANHEPRPEPRMVKGERATARHHRCGRSPGLDPRRNEEAESDLHEIANKRSAHRTGRSGNRRRDR